MSYKINTLRFIFKYFCSWIPGRGEIFRINQYPLMRNKRIYNLNILHYFNNMSILSKISSYNLIYIFPMPSIDQPVHIFYSSAMLWFNRGSFIHALASSTCGVVAYFLICHHVTLMLTSVFISSSHCHCKMTYESCDMIVPEAWSEKNEMNVLTNYEIGHLIDNDSDVDFLKSKQNKCSFITFVGFCFDDIRIWCAPLAKGYENILTFSIWCVQHY